MASADSKTENLELLLEVGRLLSSKLELSELLHTIMQLAARVVNAETASLLLVDLKTNELYFDVALGLDPKLTKIRLKMGQGIAGTVARDNKPMIINDARHDPRWDSKMDKESGFVTRSILAAPIALKGRCIGVVEAINRREGDFSFTDLRVFEAFASQAAVAIDNARLFASLREERSKLKTLLDEMQDAAVLVDARGEIALANRPAQVYFGEGASLPRVDAALAAARLALNPPLEQILASKERVLTFEALREEPKKLILAGTASLLADEDGGPAVGRVVVFRDVTEQRQEEGLKRSFLSLISHKLKTPLSSITGYSQLLLDDLKSKEGVDFLRKSLQTIHVQGTKLAGLVEKLLNYTVLEELDAAETVRTPFLIDEAAREAIEALEPWLAEHRGAAELAAESGLRVVGDPLLVRDAIKNLIENGVKFAPEGARAVSVWAQSGPDGTVELRVRDKGGGIPPEERERVFDKFYQVESSFTGQIEGWGLGLPFARKVIEKLGGSLRLESELGAGTTAVLTLPGAAER